MAGEKIKILHMLLKIYLLYNYNNCCEIIYCLSSATLTNSKISLRNLHIRADLFLL